MSLVKRLKQLRKQFGVSAPRLAVRTHIGWPWRVLAVGVIVAIVVGMVWTGFDAGRLLGGFYRSEAEEQRKVLTTQVEHLQEENRAQGARITRLESEAQIAKGAQDSLSRQAMTLQVENTQLKEELVYLQQLVSGRGKEGAISIQRATVEPEGDGQVRVRMLVVQGGTKGNAFTGKLALTLLAQQDGRRSQITLPDDQPDTSMALELDFKYYQRIDVAVRTDRGATVRSLQARVFQAGTPQPKATYNVSLN